MAWTPATWAKANRAQHSSTSPGQKSYAQLLCLNPASNKESHGHYVYTTVWTGLWTDSCSEHVFLGVSDTLSRCQVPPVICRLWITGKHGL